MTEEKQGNGSRLKGALGLDNLKGLGETLKQIKEAKQSLDEALNSISEITKDNSPMGRALAQLIEAQGIKTLNEDNVNILQEVKDKMAEELKEKDQTVEQLQEENRGLKEDKTIREVTDAVKIELDRRLPPGNPNGDGGESKLTKAVNDAVAGYLEKLLAGGETGLSSEQIRTIIKEEVGPVIGNNKKPEDMVDDVVNALTVGDKLREKLGMPGLGSRVLSPDGGGSNLRTDLVKLLLEDERDRLKIQHEHEAKVERNKQIGILVGTVKEHAGDVASAMKVAAEEIKSTEGTTKQEPPEKQPQLYRCGECTFEFSIPSGPWLEIGCPQCGHKYTREEVMSA